MIILRRFGALALGVILLGVGFGFAFVPTYFHLTKLDPFATYTGTYEPLTAKTEFVMQPILLGTNGVWCLAAIVAGTALVAGWIGVAIHTRLLSRRANGVDRSV